MEVASLIHPCLRQIVVAIDGDVRCRSQALLTVIDDTSEEVVLRILAHFSESLSEAAKAISSSIDGNDFDLAWKACHKIAGTAELLGFEKLGQDSRHLSALVKATRAKDPATIEQLARHASACLEYRDVVVKNCGNWKEYL